MAIGPDSLGVVPMFNNLLFGDNSDVEVVQYECGCVSIVVETRIDDGPIRVNLVDEFVMVECGKPPSIGDLFDQDA